uniref:Uncharacterized protein n=1 Tax=Solanum lycopersicum TaxID=4081 RepID=A0A3Q7I3V6_SOLLC
MRKVCVLELLTIKNFCQSSTRGEPINCKAAFGDQLLKDEGKFIEILRELVESASGFSVSDIFPSIKILHVLSGLRSKILKITRRILQVVKKENDVFGDEDLVDFLLRLIESGEVKTQSPMTTSNL